MPQKINAYQNGGWYEELGRAALTTAGDVITVTSIPPRKYLKLLITITGTGSVNTNIRFNNDSTASYAGSSFYNNAGSAAMFDFVSANQIYLDATASNGLMFADLSISNLSTRSKLVQGTVNQDNAVATVRTLPQNITAKWVNNSQINRIDVVNLSTGDFAIGSEFIILGHD
jgi:hypothetical protein